MSKFIYRKRKVSKNIGRTEEWKAGPCGCEGPAACVSAALVVFALVCALAVLALDIREGYWNWPWH